MDGGKEWRIIRSAAGRAYDNTIIDPIMLRFRPIAPKPAGGGYVSGSPDMDYKNAFISRGRKKRKYVRVRKNNISNKSRSKKTIIHEEDRCGSLGHGSVTLQLLPERSDTTGGSLYLSDDHAGTVAVDDLVPDQNQTPLKSSSTHLNSMGDKKASDPTAEMPRNRVVESWVTVEGMTGACMDDRDDQYNLGLTDEERMNNLEGDSCPGFISDGSNTVQWVNGAFKRMVRDGEGGAGGQLPEVTVRFRVKELLPYLPLAFTCQVKLQYTWGKERCTKFVPCDVWQMDGGGFAWKLDVKAALTLGPNSN